MFTKTLKIYKCQTETLNQLFVVDQHCAVIFLTMTHGHRRTALILYGYQFCVSFIVIFKRKKLSIFLNIIIIQIKIL